MMRRVVKGPDENAPIFGCIRKKALGKPLVFQIGHNNSVSGRLRPVLSLWTSSDHRSNVRQCLADTGPVWSAGLFYEPRRCARRVALALVARKCPIGVRILHL